MCYTLYTLLCNGTFCVITNLLVVKFHEERKSRGAGRPWSRFCTSGDTAAVACRDRRVDVSEDCGGELEVVRGSIVMTGNIDHTEVSSIANAARTALEDRLNVSLAVLSLLGRTTDWEPDPPEQRIELKYEVETSEGEIVQDAIRAASDVPDTFLTEVESHFGTAADLEKGMLSHSLAVGLPDPELFRPAAGGGFDLS